MIIEDHSIHRENRSPRPIPGTLRDSGEVSVCRVIHVFHALQILPFHQTLDPLLDHGHVGHEARVQLLDHFRNELLMTESLA